MTRPTVNRAATAAFVVLLAMTGCGPANVLDAAGDTPLMRAAQVGDVDEIRSLVRRGEDVNYRGRTTKSGFLVWSGTEWHDEPRDGLTPLMIASQSGRTDAAKALLGAGADVNLTTRLGRPGRTALWFAAREGHVETVKALLDAHADPNVAGTGVAYEAERCGHPETAVLVLRAGALVWDGLLVEAATRGHAEVLETAVKGGGASEKGLASALLAAAREGQVACIHVLLAARVSADATGIPIGWSPLGAAADQGREEAVRALLAAGAAVDAFDHPLHRACAAGHVSTVRILLEAGARSDALDDRGRTPLFAAAAAGRAAVVEVLRAASASSQPGVDDTLLAGAARRGDVETVRSLLAAGASASATLEDGTPALAAAAERGHVETVRALLAAGADPDATRRNGSPALVVAAYGAHLEIVKLLLDGGADVNVRGYRNHTAVYMASSTNHGRPPAPFMERLDAVLELLIAAGADLDVATDDGFTPLAEASNRWGNETAVRRLLRAGAAVNGSEPSPLMLASHTGSESICAALLAAGADPDFADRRGHTALMRAAPEGHVGIVRKLVAAGADPHATSLRGETAESLVLARRRGLGERRDADSPKFDEILRLLR